MNWIVALLIVVSILDVLLVWYLLHLAFKQGPDGG